MMMLDINNNNFITELNVETKMSESYVNEWVDGRAAQYILWAATAVGIPLVFLYVIVLIVLIKYRRDNFDTGFYTLFISTGIGDIIQFLTRLWGSKLPRVSKTLHDFVTTNKFITTVYVVSTMSMFQVQVVGMLFITVNRLVTFIGLFGAREYWSRYTTVFAVAVQWIWAGIYLSPLMFHQDYYVIELNANTTYFLHFEFSQKAAEFYWGSGLIMDMFINSPALIILYSTATVVLWIKRRKNLSATQRRQMNVERRLAITGAAISVLYLSLDVAAVVEALGLPGGPMAWTLFYVALDLFTYINPLFLILFSSQVKQHLFLLFGSDIANRVHTVNTGSRKK